MALTLDRHVAHDGGMKKNAEQIITEARTRPALDGQPVSPAAVDFMRNAKARNARTRAEKDASRRAAVQRALDAMR